MKKAIILSAVASLGLASASFAALSNNHTLTISNVYTTAGVSFQTNPTAAQLTTDETSGTSYIYRVAVSDSLSGITPVPVSGDPQAYGIDLENYTLSGSASRVAANIGSARANWVANNPSTVYDDNGALVPTFGTNADEGPSSTDLLSVTQIINNNPANYNQTYDDANDDNQVVDPRTIFANPGPSKEGSVDVLYGGASAAGGWLTVSGVEYNLLDETTQQFGNINYQPDGVITDAATGAIDPTPGSAGIYFQPVVAVPEPAFLSFLGLGALGFVARRRRA